MDYFRENVPVVENRAAPKPGQEVLKPREGLLIVFSKKKYLSLINNFSDEKSKVTEVIENEETIHGLYPKSWLETYFTTEKEA